MICPACHSENPEDSSYCVRCATPLTGLDETMASDTQTVRSPEPRFRVGDLFAGRYLLKGELGRGGMGVVYKAEDMKLKRFVALKLLPLELSSHQEAVQRFAQEAQAASMLDHPNICTIYEISETTDGQKYISMAYCEGESLTQCLDRGPMRPAQALEVIRQVAQALSAAHRIGVVHRDVKPANIMITSGGLVKLVDFGLAKLTGQSRLTRTSTMLGTVFYMSPEQTRGEDVDARSDLWSLGVVLYEILTARLPFPGDNTQAVTHAIIHRTPVPMREIDPAIPVEVEHLVFKCLSKRPDDRYMSAGSLQLDLERIAKPHTAPLASSATLATGMPEGSREAERRQATVMSVAVAGVSEIMEKTGYEEGALFLRKCVGFIESELRKHGGHIEATAPGEVTALFGVPRAMENAPLRAVDAAISLQKDFDEFLRRDHPGRFAGLRFGISSGIVIADAPGQGGFSVMGEAVVQSAALKDLAPPRKIYVAASTHRLTRDDFTFRILEPMYPRDRKRPLSAFEVLSQDERRRTPRAGTERTIHSDMVGREKELNKLKLQLLKAVTGQGSIVQIVGEAGIGKSRLVSELCRIEEMKSVTLLVGRGLPGGRSSSFHPLIEMLRSWTDIGSKDDSETAARKLEKAVRSVDPDGATEIYPFIARIIGLTLSGRYAERLKGIQGEALERLILRTLRELLTKAAQIRPVVIVVEDLHWADPSSIELLESLFRLAEQNPILFITLFRPNSPETGDRILRTARSRYAHFHFEIHLEPLGDDACGVLIENLLKEGATHAPVRDLISGRAEGNPFFIEEIARSLIDNGAVIIERGRFKVTEKIHDLVIPETLADVIMARVDKLEEGARTLLKMASVIGKDFTYRVLAGVNRTIDRLDERLDSLREAQLIGAKAAGPEAEYHFKHALVRDAVYDSMIPETRRKIHLDAARTTEQLYGARLPEFAGTLAMHFSRGGDDEKAEEYLIQAGEEALKVAASSVAINHYREALDIYLRKHGASADPLKVAGLEKNIAVANFNKGHMVEAVEHFDRVFELWGRGRPKRKVRQVVDLALDLIAILYYLRIPSRRGRKIPTDRDREMLHLAEKKGLALTSVDHFKMFMDMIECGRMLQTFDLSKLEDGVSIYSAVSALFSYTGLSFDISRRVLEAARSALVPGDVRSALAYAFYKLTHDYPSGEWARDRVYNLDLVNANINLGEVFRAAGYSLWSGLIAAEEGKFDEAQKSVGKLFEIGDVFEHNYARARGHLVLCTLWWKRGRLDECWKAVEEALLFMEKAGENLCILGLLGIRAHLQILRGELAEAEATLARAGELISKERRIVPFFQSHFLKSRFLFDLVRAETVAVKGTAPSGPLLVRAGRSGRSALGNAKKFAAARVEIYRLMGTWAWLRGKRNLARSWWDRSLRTGKRLGARPEMARTYMEIGRQLRTGGGHRRDSTWERSVECMNMAQALFEEMGMTADLQALEDIRRTTES